MRRLLCWLGIHDWINDLNYYPDEICDKFQLWVTKDVFRRGAPMECKHCQAPR